MIHIYFLLCPFTGTIRYVGKTQLAVKKRLRVHISKAKSFQTKNHCSNWIRSLLYLDAEPGIVSALEIEDGGDWQTAESEMIAWARSFGFDLTNATAGGDGLPELDRECLARRAEARRKTLMEPRRNAEYRRALKEARNSPHVKEAYARGAAKSWSDPVKKKAMIDGMNAPEARQRRSAASARRMRDPEVAAQHKQKMATLFQNPENREQLRQASLRRWALYRERKAQERGT